MDRKLRQMIEEAISEAYQKWGQENNKSQTRRKGKIIARNMTEAYEKEQKRVKDIFPDSCDDVSLKERSGGN